MAANTKRVFFVNYVARPGSRNCSARSDIQVDRLTNDSPDAEAESILSHAHAYQIPATREETSRRVPRHRRAAGADAQSVGDVVQRRRLRHGGRRCLHRGGRVVVNQAGGNREAVAEHVLGMMLTLSKRLIQADATCAAKPASAATINRQRRVRPDRRHRRHRPCRQQAGRSVPRACSP